MSNPNCPHCGGATKFHQYARRSRDNRAKRWKCTVCGRTHTQGAINRGREMLGEQPLTLKQRQQRYESNPARRSRHTQVNKWRRYRKRLESTLGEPLATPKQVKPLHQQLTPLQLSQDSPAFVVRDILSRCLETFADTGDLHCHLTPNTTEAVSVGWLAKDPKHPANLYPTKALCDRAQELLRKE